MPRRLMYVPFPSVNKKYKYSVYVVGGLISFGTRGTGDWRDGNVSEKKRQGYLNRLKSIKNAEGDYCYKDINSACYWCFTYLWGGEID